MGEHAPLNTSQGGWYWPDAVPGKELNRQYSYYKVHFTNYVSAASAPVQPAVNLSCWN